MASRTAGRQSEQEQPYRRDACGARSEAGCAVLFRDAAECEDRDGRGGGAGLAEELEAGDFRKARLSLSGRIGGDLLEDGAEEDEVGSGGWIGRVIRAAGWISDASGDNVGEGVAGEADDGSG
jgi:hypothetical protein